MAFAPWSGHRSRTDFDDGSRFCWRQTPSVAIAIFGVAFGSEGLKVALGQRSRRLSARISVPRDMRSGLTIRGRHP
jgi:hypothetical protein